jgi:hypothetical protein
MKSVQHGVADANADTFKELEASREAGTLAGNRELAAEGTVAVAASSVVFDEKTEEELMKLTKKEILAYAADLAKHTEALADEKAENMAKAAEVSAIHGIPRGKVGEPIKGLLEGNPDHPGRGVPYALLDDDGEPRMSKGNKKRPPSPVTRADN